MVYCLRTASNNMKNLLSDRLLSFAIRQDVIRCYIQSSLLYAIKVFALYKKQLIRLKVIEMRLQRWILKVLRIAKLSNANILKKANSKRMLINITIRRKIRVFRTHRQKGKTWDTRIYYAKEN